MSETEGEKKRGLKLRWKILMGLVVVVIAALVAVAVSLDGIAKVGLEKGATAALGTETTVGSVDLGVLSGSLRLSEMAVANPEGYPEGYLFKLADADMSLEIGSLLSDTIHVRRIVLNEPIISIVRKGLETNLGAVLKNAETEGADDPSGEPGAASKRFRIDLIRIIDAQFEYQLAGAPPVKVKLPTIEIRDMGNEKGGAVMLADLFSQVLRSMASEAVQISGADLPEEFAGALQDIASGGREAVEKTIKAGDDLIKSGGEAVKGVADLFKGLRGSSDDDQ